jgi:single-strand DNA-binding protein
MPDLRMPPTNTVIIAARLGRDPELKYTSGGQAYCKLAAAHDENYKDAAGAWQKKPVWLSVTLWREAAEAAGNNLRKGDPVMIEGRLTQNEWTDKQTGQKRTQLEISASRVTPLSWPAKDGEQGPAPRAATPAPQQAPAEEPIPEDDIPF